MYYLLQQDDEDGCFATLHINSVVVATASSLSAFAGYSGGLNPELPLCSARDIYSEAGSQSLVGVSRLSGRVF